MGSVHLLYCNLCTSLISDIFAMQPFLKIKMICLFDLSFYIPVNNFSVVLGWVFLG